MLIQLDINEDLINRLSDKDLEAFKRKMSDQIIDQVKKGHERITIKDKDKNELLSLEQVRTYEKLLRGIDRIQEREHTPAERRERIFDALFIIEHTPKWNPGKTLDELGSSAGEVAGVMRKYPAYRDGKHGTLANVAAYNASLLYDLRSNRILTEHSFTPDDELFINAINDPRMQKAVRDAAIKNGIESLTRKIPFGRERGVTEEELNSQCACAFDTVRAISRSIRNESPEKQSEYLSFALRTLPRRIREAEDYRECFRSVETFREYERRGRLIDRLKEEGIKMRTVRTDGGAKTPPSGRNDHGRGL